jgi:isopenicillin N synthase-like dioxygenase
MLSLFAVALGMTADYFAPFFAGKPNARLRFLHYPPQDTTEDHAYGQRPHTDNSFMTVLAEPIWPGSQCGCPVASGLLRRPSGERF